MPPLIETYAELAARILSRPARLGRTRLVAVDGPSGAGKTVFAGRLASALDGLIAAIGSGTAGAHGSPAGGGPEHRGWETPVVHTDDLLCGWADQFTFWLRLDEWVLAPLRAGRPGHYCRYDWARGRFTRPLIPVLPVPVLILEGVSTARSAIAAELTLAVFVTAPARLCRQRTLARDGAAMAPQLRLWRRAERAHFAADRTAERADLVVDGAAGTAQGGSPGTSWHDDATFVRIR